jgi:hypothetical protein
MDARDLDGTLNTKASLPSNLGFANQLWVAHT